MSYLEQALPGATPQDRPIPGSTQTLNRAGGYTWDVDEWRHLRRFLILGTAGGSHYEDEATLTGEAADSLRKAIDGNGGAVVELVVEVSQGGFAPKNDPALFALALAASAQDPGTREKALRALPLVARTGTHLFTFFRFLDLARGWGRSARRGVAAWYEDKEPRELAYQLIKYRQRDGVTHRDVLRSAHPKAPTPLHQGLYDFACGRTYVFGDASETGHDDVEPVPAEVRIVEGFLRAQRASTPEETAELVAAYGLPREAVKPEHLKSTDVWEALLQDGMPMTALIRNLATLTRIGMVSTGSEWTRRIADQVTDAEKLRAARVHPLALLLALFTYKAGHSLRGDSAWQPVAAITDALDEAFYLAFPNAPKIGRPTMVAVDDSGSMGTGQVAGIPDLTPQIAAAALALVTVHTEDNVEVYAFDSSIRHVPVSRRQRLDDAVATFRNSGGSTNCALPAQLAESERMNIDAFVVLTDGMTWAGNRHPAEALRSYRRSAQRPDAVQANVAMVANKVTITDPGDKLSMDFVGFDAATPGLIAEFAGGRL